MSRIFPVLKWSMGTLTVLFLLSVVCSSCGDTRHITYMQGQFDTARLSQINVPEPIIRKGDILSIIVYSDNPQATVLYNQSLITTGTGGSQVTAESGASSGGTMSAASPSSPGYVVDEGGNITFQGLGRLHVEGLTRANLKDSLDARLAQYLKNPYYTIRFINYKFTILGEINRPGIYSLPADRVNLLQAFGMSGDLTFYGRRDNVLVIRENGNKREFARLDLTKPEIMSSPYFYLQQNDLVIIEATKKRVAASDQVTVRNVSIAASVVSTLAILYSIFRK